jgi:tight adherence protein B
VSAAPSAADVGATVLRVAVLLQAGLSPVRAWETVAESEDAAARRVHDGAAQGDPLAAAIAREGGAWQSVAAAWAIATTVGAPLADTLRGIAAALRDAQETTDDVRVTLAEPAGTARLMAWLPLVGLGLGAAMGFDTLTTLFTNPWGIGCLVLGATLIVAAHRWTSSLVKKAQPEGAIPGLRAELMAIALSGGASIDRARALVASVAPGDRDEQVESVLDLSRRAGVPAVELLVATASLARHRARIDGRLGAARLASRLLLPLGVCTLPAFLLLGVAPMLLSVVSTMSPALTVSL